VTTLVYDLSGGSEDACDQLGDIGAELAGLTALGLPVPPGFVISARAAQHHAAADTGPAELADQVSIQMHVLERRMGRKLGQVDDPLLVSVRCGTAHPGPGVITTVPDIGLTDASVSGFAAASGDPHTARYAYHRLVARFGAAVLGVPAELFEATAARARSARRARRDADLTVADLRRLVEEDKRVLREHSGQEFPQDPCEQVELAIRAVFASWHAPEARRYRLARRLPDEPGTTVVVRAMVFGTLGATSGAGLAYTRDPVTGCPGGCGRFLPTARCEDVLEGSPDALSLAELERLHPDCHAQLLTALSTMERSRRDMCEVRFVVERGTLWILRARPAPRHAAAAFRIAMTLHDEGLIDLDEALLRVSGDQLTQLLFPCFDPNVPGEHIASGVAAAPGAAVGHAVFDSATAVRWANSGRPVILVRTETTPDDLDAMTRARGVLTSRGGQSSHAAVTARGLGRTCVCGTDQVVIDARGRRFSAPGGVLVREGDIISIDGGTGAVCLGAVPVVPSAVVEYFEGRLTPDADELVSAVHRLLDHADTRRMLRVRANADTPVDAARARRFGADGIGLCRTEHMFTSERRSLIERLIVAEQDDHQERADVLAELLPLHRRDFATLFQQMDGLPVTVRLLDPPLHEFLPDLTDLSVRVALAETRHAADVDDVWLLRVVRRLHEHNPMLGLRGVRLGLVVPELYEMQVRAIAEATAQRLRDGGCPQVEIMIPLVVDDVELSVVRDRAEAVLTGVAERTGTDLPITLGTMIELPRAALTAGRIARQARFFSFGTNDLTQTTWGMSRDDVESAFLPVYQQENIVNGSPFRSIDEDGVGRLIMLATGEGRAARPDLGVGVCGEHGGDPASIHFFHRLRIDHVSCSPFRVPVARLEAGRAAVHCPRPSAETRLDPTRARLGARNGSGPRAGAG
jgi:pyruvate,orthophosphate dikinase